MIATREAPALSVSPILPQELSWLQHEEPSVAGAAFVCRLDNPILTCLQRPAMPLLTTTSGCHALDELVSRGFEIRQNSASGAREGMQSLTEKKRGMSEQASALQAFGIQSPV